MCESTQKIKHKVGLHEELARLGLTTNEQKTKIVDTAKYARGKTAY